MITISHFHTLLYLGTVGANVLTNMIQPVRDNISVRFVRYGRYATVRVNDTVKHNLSFTC